MCIRDRVYPVVDIAKEAGIEIGTTGAIKVNSRMETNIPDIYACGDCAEKINIISHSPVWIPLGSTANKEGRVAAINACGGVEDFEGVLGSAVLRYHSLSMSMTGLTEKAAQKRGYDTEMCIRDRSIARCLALNIASCIGICSGRTERAIFVESSKSGIHTVISQS